jgi:transcriptional regulator with XRE-family HTH domain
MNKENSINLKVIGERLKEVRTAFGYTLEKMQEMCGVAKSTISEMETGRKKPHFLYLYLLSTKFNVNIDWILSGRGPKSSEFDIKLDFGQDNEVIKEMIYQIEKFSFIRYDMLQHYLKIKNKIDIQSDSKNSK